MAHDRNAPETNRRRVPEARRTAGAGAVHETLSLAAMLFAVSMTFIDQTMVSIAAPQLTEELGLSASGIRWVVNAYLLALAACFALGGRLADLLGHRRIMFLGTGVFVLAAALCGAVPAGDAAQTWLIVCRAVQGIGAALMFPAALAVVVMVLPAEGRGRAPALFFGLSGALTAIGPVLGGWLTTWTWRAVFWVNVPVAVVAVVLTLPAHLPDERRRGSLDRRGALLLATGTVLSVLGLQQAATWGWASAATWACIVGGLLVLAVFVRLELRTRHPLISLRVFGDRAFVADITVLFFAMLAFVPVFFFASVYAQVALGSSPNEAGRYLLVFFAGFGVAAQLGGRILDRRGARPAIRLGTALGAVGFALWAHEMTDLSLSAQWPYIVLAGAGIGLLLAPASTDAVSRAIGTSYGEVTGVTQTVRNYAAGLGLAVLGTVLANVTTDRIVASLKDRGLSTATSRELAHGLTDSLSAQGGRPPAGEGASSRLPPEVLEAVRMDFAEGNRAVFYGMAAALAVAFLCAHLHPGTRLPQAPPSGAGRT
ncbi:MFS transporter [Streptomyces sioyaensis]|uniref:MFS transporter n=1 Tax=Streptomyces sioyaensis TaxID=67364 RepID=UPI0037D53394